MSRCPFDLARYRALAQTLDHIGIIPPLARIIAQYSEPDCNPRWAHSWTNLHDNIHHRAQSECMCNARERRRKYRITGVSKDNGRIEWILHTQPGGVLEMQSSKYVVHGNVDTDFTKYDIYVVCTPCSPKILFVEFEGGEWHSCLVTGNVDDLKAVWECIEKDQVALSKWHFSAVGHKKCICETIDY